MQKIPLSLARKGMVLEKPVLRDNGLVLVAPGTEISDSLLAKLENMGVQSVTVEGHPVEMEGQAAPKSFQERIDGLDHLFRRYREDAWMNKLKELIRIYLKRRMATAEHAAKATHESPGNTQAASEQK